MIRSFAWLAVLAAVAFRPDAPALPSPGFDDLVRLVERDPRTGAPVQSVAELIPLLPREIRANFTFVHDSESPHGERGDGRTPVVTPARPRAILFSADARLLVALQGDGRSEGSDLVEVIHFDDEKAAFVLARFILPAAVARDPSLAIEAKDNGRPNPPACLRCHGADPRPLFDSYPLWPGFYGGVRDTFPPGSAEISNYRAFLAAQRDAPDGLYRSLIWPAGTTVPPYSDPARFDPRAVEIAPEELRLAPNTRLGMALTELNRKRIHRKLAASPAYARSRYGLLAGLLGCAEMPPGGAIDKSLSDRTWIALVRESLDRRRRIGIRHGEETQMEELRFHRNAVELRALAAALGVDPSDWSMSGGEGSLALYDGILSGLHADRSYYLKEDFILEMLRGLARDESSFATDFATRRVFAGFGYPFGERLDIGRALAACPRLRELSGYHRRPSQN